MPAKRRKEKTWVEISKRALIHNARLFRERIGKDIMLMGVVKANAYGHGLAETAEILNAKVDWFGVDNIDEALALKKAGIKKPILTLGFTPSWRMADAARHGIRIVVGDIGQIRSAKKAAEKAKRTLHLHVKVETGTARQGVDLRDLPEATKLITASPCLVFEGMSTHYANVEDAENRAFTTRQLEHYDQALKLLEVHGVVPKIRHTASTAAAILYPETHFDMVRVGIGLYGIWPSRETREAVVKEGLDFPIKPVLAWKTHIAQVKDVKRGAPVSYGLTERMPRSGRLAVLGAGYWDGIDRGLSSRGYALVRGQRCKIIGRVCMNMCMIDVTDVKSAKAEDEVILIGESGHEKITAEEVAGRIDTIGYEVVARINPLAPRVVK